MGFQKSVNTDPAIATPGIEVNPGQAVYTAYNFISDGTVQAGTFAFAVALTAGGANAMNAASAKGTAGAKPLGFVERNQIGMLMPFESASVIYPKGTGLPIAIRGQFYAVAQGDATDGQAVLCNPVDGKITYGAAGAANDTGWVVRMPRGVAEAAEGDIVIYECWGVTVGGAAAGKAVADEAIVDEDAAV